MAARVNINVSSATKKLRAVGQALQYSSDTSAQAFTQAALPLVEAAVYSDGDGLAAMAAELAPVDTGALVAGLVSPDSNEGLCKEKAVPVYLFRAGKWRRRRGGHWR